MIKTKTTKKGLMRRLIYKVLQAGYKKKEIRSFELSNGYFVIIKK